MKNNLRKIIAFAGCIFILKASYAQVNMNLQVPPTGVLLKSQLWNMLLVSSNDGTLNVEVDLSLQDIQTNQVLLTAKSRTIQLVKGANQLQVNDLSPIQYSYYSAIFNSDTDPNGFLPVGAYMACFTVSSTGAHGTILSENCISVNVEALSPPMLNTPTDQSILETNYPMFSWLPPTPLQIFSDLSYDLILVEVLPGQSSSEAIQNNIPINSVPRTRDQFLNYPASSIALDTGRVFAWRIIARNNNSFFVPSDIWTFTIQSNSLPDVETDSSAYILLKRADGLNGSYTFQSENIRIKYYSFDQSQQMDMKVLNAQGEIVKTMRQQINYGENFLICPLGNAVQSDQLYTIEIEDKSGNKYVASFRIQ